MIAWDGGDLGVGWFVQVGFNWIQVGEYILFGLYMEGAGAEAEKVEMIEKSEMIKKTEKAEWTAEENLTEATALKEQGNTHFKSQDLRSALRCYHKAILHLAGIIDKSSSVAMYSKSLANEQTTSSSKSLKFTIYLNMAQIYISQNKHDRGLQVLAKAKEIQTNAKFYYRRAICLMKVSEFDLARADIKVLVELDPSFRENAEVVLREVAELEKLQDKKSKAMYSKFFK